MSSKKKKKAYRSGRRNFLNPLFSRMLVSYLAVTLCLIMAVGVTVIAICKNAVDIRYQEELKRTLSSAGEMLRFHLEQTGFRNMDSLPDSLKDTLTTISSEHNVLIQLVTEEDNYFFSTDSVWEKAKFAEKKSPEEIIRLLGNDMQKNGFFRNELGIVTITCGSPIYYGGTMIGVLLVHGDHTGNLQVIQNIAMAIVLVALVAVFLATIAVYHTTNRMIRPFMQINETVQQYAKGDFNKRIPISGITEATQLARSFNAMADQLNDLESTRRSFVSNVSHELRSPLTSMGGFLEAMHDGTIPPEDFEKYIEIVLSENKRMTVMVNDLLDLARIESGKTVMRPEVFDINELIRRVLLTFEARIYEQKMDVEVKFAQEQLLVEADNAQISQVLRNLIDNAIKYSSSGGRLRLATYSMRSLVYVSVSDSGIGIPDEDIPFVFDRFYKVEKAHTPRKQSGTGLGLSIVKKILDQHGQTISVQSMQSKGTTFTFTLKRVLPQRNQQDLLEEGVRYGR